jgi:hypothetical protein
VTGSARIELRAGKVNLNKIPMQTKSAQAVVSNEEELVCRGDEGGTKGSSGRWAGE